MNHHDKNAQRAQQAQNPTVEVGADVMACTVAPRWGKSAFRVVERNNGRHGVDPAHVMDLARTTELGRPVGFRREQ